MNMNAVFGGTVPRITSRPGDPRDDDGDGKPDRTHKGTDYAAAKDRELYAPGPGSVRRGWTEKGGAWLSWAGDDGATMTLRHLAQPGTGEARDGERVEAGDLLARVGYTGETSWRGYHVHVEVGD